MSMAGERKRRESAKVRRIKLVACGRYSIRGIGIIFIRGRHKAGESIASLADDYNLTRTEVLRAINFGKRVKL